MHLSSDISFPPLPCYTTRGVLFSISAANDDIIAADVWTAADLDAYIS